MRKLLEFVGIDIGITAKYKCKQTMREVSRHLVNPLFISDDDDYTGLLQCQSTWLVPKLKFTPW